MPFYFQMLPFLQAYTVIVCLVGLFTQTHRDECFRFVAVYMFAVLFQSTLFLMMAIDLLLAVVMPIRHKLWQRGPYLIILCTPPLAFSSLAVFIERLYTDHDDLLICTVTLAAPRKVRFWGTLITFSTVFLAVVLILMTAVKVHSSGCLLMISTLAHTICLISELICVKLKLRFTQTHRDECFRSVIVYMFAVLFQSTLFLMMAIDLFLAVIMPIRHKLWRRGPYLLVLCIPPLAFSCFALFIEEIYINHDDLLICTVTLAAPPTVRFWGTLITFSTIFLAVTLIFVTAFRVHINERESARRILRHSNSVTSNNNKCSDAKLLKSLSTLMFVFVCSWSLSILLSHVSLYFHKSVAYEIQKYNFSETPNLLPKPINLPFVNSRIATIRHTFPKPINLVQNLNFKQSSMPQKSSSHALQGIKHGYYDDGVTDSAESEGFKVGRRIFKNAPDLSESRLNFRRIDNDGYALSAFTDDRNGNMGYKFVRVMMVITGKDDFECEINRRTSEDVSFYEFSENHGKKMQLFILNCKLPEGIEFAKVDTIKVTRVSTGAFVNVPITYRIQDEKSITPDEYDLKMSICVPALFGNVYDAKRIVEFVELNSFQEIERIFIYYNPKEITSEKMKRALNYYSDNHVVQLVEFELPFFSDDIWYHGQLATITDCLLRNTGISKYTFFHDIDEFFVPVTELTLFETVDKIFRDPTIGSQRTALKYIATKDTNAPITLNNIVSSKRLETRFTKCVVRPEMVFEQGIHHTSRVIQDQYQTVSHDGSLLRVYHYKEPTYCCEDESILKKRYGSDLRKQFDYVVQQLEL
ncbi:unnamed protein product [Caenorhabditis sp. 36 PRJEB53466]|nr:unnamed protein product [Caenorhabditis sp. 36 PRJEB53466]